MKAWTRVAVSAALGAGAAAGVLVTAPPRLDAATAAGLRVPDPALGVPTGQRPTELEGLERHLAGPRRNDFYAWRWLGEAYRARGRADKAREAWARSAALSEPLLRDPELSSNSMLWFAHGWCRWRLGDPDGARPAMRRAEELLLERARAMRSPAQTWAYIGHCRVVLGDASGAAEAWGRALDVFERSLGDGPERAGEAYDLARFRALAGDAAGSLEALERAVASGWSDAGRAEWEPDLESVRAEPRFAEALSRARAEARGRAGAR